MNKPKILIIDDESGIREAFRMILKDDYTIYTAKNGREGLKQFEKQRVDLVVLDIMMPELNGIEVLARIKKIDPTIKVTMITATKDVKSARDAMKLGAFDYITKPFDIAQIRALAAKALKDYKKK
jgi:DNA-binding NtrC family response regulator